MDHAPAPHAGAVSSERTIALDRADYFELKARIAERGQAVAEAEAAAERAKRAIAETDRRVHDTIRALAAAHGFTVPCDLALTDDATCTLTVREAVPS